MQSPSTATNEGEPNWLAERYVVEETLGEGGMGAIHRVTDTLSDTRVALKRLKLQGNDGDETRVALFQREYQTLQQLAHPRIIRVFDYGLAAGGPYYTMELLDGQDMRKLAPLEPMRSCSLLRDVASSLAIVHSRGLVYRDLSQRNVRCTSDGRAKLLDFGALTPMETPKQLVGTPAFIPPEAVYWQPLDQRADMYSLGVLAYWLLTGCMPFPVRGLGGLRDAWRTPPAPLSTLAPDVPEALSALVMSLLSLNPTGRPQHTGEVIDRLTSIGKLPPERDLGVMQAYLTTPELVGRDDELLRLRKALVRCTRARGSAFVVRADPGAGSSRLIDAAVLEAKLVGALTARAETGTYGSKRFGAVLSTVDQWAAGLPSAVADGLGASVRAAVENDGQSADGLHERVAAALLKVAGRRAALVAIDDAHHLDPASAAVLALLAQACPDHKLVVIATVPAGFDYAASIPLRMLVSASRAIELQAWRLPQTEALLRSVFGDVASVPLVADRIQRVALGNARNTMRLAKHLVETGVARHQEGAWLLPTKLNEVALPSSMAQAQRDMLTSLDSKSRWLATALALSPTLDRLSLVDLARLMPDALARLDALVRKGILTDSGAGFAFPHGGVADALTDSLQDGAQRELHLALVAMHRAGGHHALTIAYHLDRAGAYEDCLEIIRPTCDGTVYHRLVPHQAELLERIVIDDERYALSARQRQQLRGMLVQHAAIVDPQYGWHAEASLAQLRQDTGLCFWDDYADVESDERIRSCLKKAQQVYDATPEDRRAYPPLEAVRELSKVVRNLTSVCSRTLASDKLAGLAAWLEPFRSLAPIIDIFYRMTVTSAERMLYSKRVAHRYLGYAEGFSQPMAGIDDAVREGAAAICTYCVAMDEAKRGKEYAPTRVEPLAQVDFYAAMAWHVRMLSHIYSGRTAEATKCRQRMDLLVIQQSQTNTLLAMSILFEAGGYAMCEDLGGLKSAVERVAQEAERYPGWRPWEVVYRGDVHRLRGDLEAALLEYERAASITAPGRHQVWIQATERRVVALSHMDRLEEALPMGRSLCKFAEEVDLEPVTLSRIYVGMALATAKAGLAEEASETMAKALACVEREGLGGVPRGLVHEGEARLAILKGDAQAFFRAQDECASYLLAGDNAALTAKHERLLMEASAANVMTSASPMLAQEHAVNAPHPALQRLRDACGERERNDIILNCLTEYYQADGACLFGVMEDGTVLLATTGEAGNPNMLRPKITEYLQAEVTATCAVTVTVAETEAASGGADCWNMPEEGRHVPVLLPGQRDGTGLIAAVAVVRVGEDSPPPEPRLLRALGQAMLDGGQVTGMRVAG